MRVVAMGGAGRFFAEHAGGAGALLQRECGGSKICLPSMGSCPLCCVVSTTTAPYGDSGRDAIK